MFEGLDVPLAMSSVTLPEDCTTRRSMPAPIHKRTDDYVRKFDFRTLIYDAFRRGDEIVMVCPRLLNLWPVLRDGLRLNGQRPNIKRHRRLRFEILRLSVKALPNTPVALTVSVEGRTIPVSVGPDLSHLFKAKRCLLAMVKDTPTDWITDWVRWHATLHGTNALLLFDNGTTRFDMAETPARLRAMPDLEQVVVVSAPFPYGGNAGGRFFAPAKYLQAAMLNLAKERFLATASSVLSVDVDELVQPIPGTTIHELTEKSRLGLVWMRGQWVYAETTSGPVPHSSHGLSVPDDPERIATKWCAVPSRALGRRSWDIHRPGGILGRLALGECRYWHFRSTTTGWKRAVNCVPKGAIPDQQLIEGLRTVFGPATHATS
mgnify:CR=1 FL=1